MGRRRLAREAVLQALYLADVSTTPAAEAYEGIIRGFSDLDEKSEKFGLELVEGAALHRDAIDDALQATADNWELKRMTAVDRNILRMASYELLHNAETPVSVVIDEALEIAKKYSSDDSPGFINGILDKIKNKRPAEPKAQ